MSFTIATTVEEALAAIAAADLAKTKGLGIVAGTQRRHDPRYVETIRRIHDGQIGDVISGQVYWRFYPLTETQAKATAGEVLRLIEANREEMRQELPPEENPFTYLLAPLNAAIDQLGEEYKSQVAERTQDEFTRRLAALELVHGVSFRGHRYRSVYGDLSWPRA